MQRTGWLQCATCREQRESGWYLLHGCLLGEREAWAYCSQLEIRCLGKRDKLELLETENELQLAAKKTCLVLCSRPWPLYSGTVFSLTIINILIINILSLTNTVSIHVFLFFCARERLRESLTGR